MGRVRGHWMGLFSMCNYERYYTSGRTESVSPIRIHVFNDPDTMCEIRRETLTSVGVCVYEHVCVCVCFFYPSLQNNMQQIEMEVCTSLHQVYQRHLSLLNPPGDVHQY